MIHTQRMGESGVFSPGKHKVSDAKLANSPQSLHRPGVDQLKYYLIGDLDNIVNRISDVCRCLKLPFLKEILGFTPFLIHDIAVPHTCSTRHAAIVINHNNVSQSPLAYHKSSLHTKGDLQLCTAPACSGQFKKTACCRSSVHPPLIQPLSFGQEGI